MPDLHVLKSKQDRTPRQQAEAKQAVAATEVLPTLLPAANTPVPVYKLAQKKEMENKKLPTILSIGR